MEQLETLKFSNHWQVLSSQLWEFAGNQTYTDLTLICSNGQLEVHSPIMYKMLNYFNIEISEQVFSDNKTVVLPDVSMEEISSHLKILYATGNSDIMFQFLTGYEAQQRKENVKTESEETLKPGTGAQQKSFTPEEMMNISLLVEGVKEEAADQGGGSRSEAPVSPVLFKEWDETSEDMVDKEEYQVTPDRSYECTECDKVFIRRDHLKRHMVKSHNQTLSTTPRKKASKNSELKKEKTLKKEENEEYYCTQCGKKFTRKDHLKRHAITHTGEKPFSCEFCGSRFTRTDALVQHKLGCQTKNETPAEVLKVVGKSEGKTLDKLSKVLFGKVVEYIWGCKICYSVFETEPELERHRQENHGEGSQSGQYWNQQTNKYSCPICEKVLKTKHLVWFIYHMEKCKRGEGSVLPGEMDNYLCHICSKPFTSKQTLNMHVNYVHTMERPFKCTMCHKSYKIKSELSQHEMTHSDHYNYSCETCGKQFRGKVNLRMHMKTHLSDEEKKHICNMCGHRFARLQHLRNHLTTHSSVGTFPCDVCGAKSKTMDALRQHKKSHRSVAGIGVDKNFPANPPGRPTAADKSHMEAQRQRAMIEKNFAMEHKPYVMDQKPFMPKMELQRGMESTLVRGMEVGNERMESPSSHDGLEQQRHFLSKLEAMEGHPSVNLSGPTDGLEHQRQFLSRLGGMEGMEGHHSVEHFALMRNYNKLYNS